MGYMGWMTRRARWWAAAGVALVLGPAVTAAEQSPAQRRVALVIGNAAYEAPGASLTNPLQDANGMAAVLRDLDFDVVRAMDATKAEMERATNTFVGRVRPGDVAVFYYAGHGMELGRGNDRENYLAPVEFSAAWDEVDARHGSVNVNWVQEKMESAGAAVRIVILDACRNNPFEGTRTLTRGGLARLSARGGFVAYAAGAGALADDDPGAENGLYTKHLLAALRVPGLNVRDLFARVRAAVYEESNNGQRPAVYDELVGDFVFRAERPVPSRFSYSQELGRAWSPSHVDENGWTDLHYAAVLGRTDLARRLLDAGASIDARLLNDSEPFSQRLRRTLRAFGFGDTFDNWNRDAEAPLHLAVRYSASVAVVELLLNRGARVEAMANDLRPLHYATADGLCSVDMVDLLLDRGARIDVATDDGRTPLHRAAWSGCAGEAELLLDRGANIESATDNGLTPLYRAAWSNSVGAVELLLNRGANIEAANSDGLTPLHQAAWSNSVGAVELLLNRGANIGAVSSRDWTPLHHAARNGSVGAVELLLDRGANIEAVNDSDVRPLSMVFDMDSGEAHLDVAELLLNRGANIDVKGFMGTSLLDGAVLTSSVEAMKFFLDRGANIEAVNDDDGCVSLHYAARRGDVGAVELLLDRSANIEAVNDAGNTPLHEAARGRFNEAGSVAVVELLLNRGANLDVRNSSGQTPLEVAPAGAIRSALEAAVSNRQGVAR